MSLGYAQKLSYREDVGSVGMTEIFDPSNVLRKKIEDLAMLIQKSKHLVAFTGAGISTSSGIPDFRGPKGIWTLQQARKVLPEASLPFHRAMPSLTHMALVELEKTGVLKFVISQNVDNLHLRSGIPREKLAELHGNSFREICSKCGLEYIRDFEVETIGMKETSRRCSAKHCGRKLTDTVLDWEDALPPEEMEPATKHCKMADVVLCLGTSLQITPACNLPMKCLRAGGKMVIVNLQPTPKDKKAALVIHGQVDKVVAGVMDFLNMRIPPYVRIDLVQLVVSRSSKRGKFVNWTIKISSVDGPKAPLPFLKSVEISFPESPDMESVLLFEQPFSLMRESIKSRSLNMLLQLNFADGCGCPFLKIEKALDFQDSLESFTCERGNLLQQLRDESLQDSECGRHVMLQRKFSSNPNSESTTYGVVTSLLTYNEETGLSERNGACMLTKREPPTAVKDEGSEISNLGLDTHEQPQMHDNVQMPESNTRNLSDDKLEIPSGNSHDGISEVNGQDKPILKHQVSEIYKDSKTFKRKRTGLTDNGVQNRASA